jgi:hypothetical protein
VEIARHELAQQGFRTAPPAAWTPKACP